MLVLPDCCAPTLAAATQVTQKWEDGRKGDGDRNGKW